ncbi:MAG: cytochrome c [Hyphomicrobiaceae bacterium]|nr:cytochrome c [Hyphomicrobiaceae bacterium]
MNTKLLIIAALLSLIFSISGALADGMKSTNSIAYDREELMEAAGLAKEIAGNMVKGKTAWDGKQAELAMRTLQSVAMAFAHKVPEGSMTEEGEASPAIWKDMQDFLHQVAELQSHSSKAAKAARIGLEAFKPEFVATVKYCKSCHEKYRVRKKI